MLDTPQWVAFILLLGFMGFFSILGFYLYKKIDCLEDIICRLTARIRRLEDEQKK